ncbi:6-phospho-beta-glucosidase [Curtobacterium sp. 320]|uniref:6-phospho-beta-glucosidase n=1 Tax=unclassified Curtobacterium TaxID=257496 RepID=UPI00089DF912|nr:MULTISPECIES: 6-phospho-beta-glucosidase [unclassified Curtobacterium]AOX64888.1 6-phospho-beta-glucosidase [Curtobacterium sp. BH-2-1-1]MDR6574135.1 6-phospho-beta-glucosidase [Curtobacterium sp. 320]
MKLAVIGGGSTYTPELVDGFARLRDQLPIDELWLVDPDPVRRELVGGVAKRMFAHAGHPGTIHVTDDVVAGVSDADAVMFQLRIGGQAARHQDETWPHEACCIGQETTGPGGFAKALRTVPVVLEYASLVKRYAKPDAWIVDFTNPVGIVTRALLEAGHRAVGLCNVAIGFQRRFAKEFDVAPSAVRLDHVGLNHLTWERGVHVSDGSGERDVLSDLLRADTGALDRMAESVHMPADLIRLQHAVPSYYLRYFYSHDVVLEEQLHAPTRAEAVMETERALLAKYADESVVTKPAELEQRGGAYYSEAAIDVLSSILGDRGDVQVLNVRNDGTFPFLPDDHVIEVPARVTRAAITPLPVAPLDADMVGLVSHVAGYERLALDAAVHGGRDRVLRAMWAHPLVGQVDKAERLTDLLLAANAEHLPWTRSEQLTWAG